MMICNVRCDVTMERLHRVLAVLVPAQLTRGEGGVVARGRRRLDEELRACEHARGSAEGAHEGADARVAQQPDEPFAVRAPIRHGIGGA